MRSAWLLCAVLVCVGCATMVLADTWHVDDRVFLQGPAGAFDRVSVKDPSIVYANGKYHLFYTGMDGVSVCRMGYASATTLQGLRTAQHVFMSTLNGGNYFCAPQVVYYAAKNQWYLIYQNQGATYSTNSDPSNPSGWSEGKPMGFNDGIDFWTISDGANVYAFYSAQDDARTIRTRHTTVAAFPFGWSAASVAVTNAFEAVHVYKSRADGKYYMMVEHLFRWFQLHVANSLAGPWTLVQEHWADGANLVFNAGVAKWTGQVSHGEIIRYGNNEFLEINDIKRCDVIFQGVNDGDYGGYGLIPYTLGIMHNYVGSQPTTCSTPANPANGAFTCAGGVCSLVCNANYAPTGTGYASCNNGAWSTLPACVPSGNGASACNLVSENADLALSCSGAVITAVEYASYGTPKGDCTTPTLGACHAQSSLSVMASNCVGKASCTVKAANSVFSDPCSGTQKQMAVRARCAAAETVCASGSEWAALTLACPAGKVVTGISFASYGTPTGSCSAGFATSTCHASTSLDLVQKACVGKNSCSISSMNALFGDPCSGTGKTLSIQALCA